MFRHQFGQAHWSKMASDIIGNPPPQELSETAIVAIIEDRIKRGIYAPGSRDVHGGAMFAGR